MFFLFVPTFVAWLHTSVFEKDLGLGLLNKDTAKPERRNSVTLPGFRHLKRLVPTPEGGSAVLDRHEDHRHSPSRPLRDFILDCRPTLAVQGYRGTGAECSRLVPKRSCFSSTSSLL